MAAQFQHRAAKLHKLNVDYILDGVFKYLMLNVELTSQCTFERVEHVVHADMPS